MSLICRYAGAADFAELAQMRKALVEEERGSSLDPKESLTLISETAIGLRDDNVLVPIVLDGDVPVGMLWCISGSLVGPDKGTMRTDFLYIKPEYRRSRAMALLWEAGHSTAKASKRGLLQGVVLADNTAVLNMHRKRGARIRAYIVEKEVDMPKPDRDSRGTAGASSPSHEAGSGGGGTGKSDSEVFRSQDEYTTAFEDRRQTNEAHESSCDSERIPSEDCPGRY